MNFAKTELLIAITCLVAFEYFNLHLFFLVTGIFLLLDAIRRDTRALY